VLLQLLATAATGSKLQVGTTIYFRRLTTDVQDSGEWGCPAGVVWEESSPVMQQLEAADPDWPYGTALA
jgi:hypothetical protein